MGPTESTKDLARGGTKDRAAKDGGGGDRRMEEGLRNGG
jgi:hypothetical protein